MEYQSFYESPVGTITLMSDGKFLTELGFSRLSIGELRSEAEEQKEELEIFVQTKKWLERYFRQENPDPKEIPIKLSGTEFREAVWRELQKIPYGKTVTYGFVAEAVAKERGMKRMSAQAVGQAVGSNPIAIIIPCHRVVGAKGNLVGYGGGLDVKIGLLQNEKVENVKFFE